MMVLLISLLITLTNSVAASPSPFVVPFTQQEEYNALFVFLKRLVNVNLTNNYKWRYKLRDGHPTHSIAFQANNGCTELGDTQEDVFCGVINGKNKERFLFETAHSIAFLSTDRMGHGCTEQDTHLLIIPLRHEHQLHHLTQEEVDDLFASAAYVAAALGSELNYECAVNNGCFQHVYHVHLHVMIKGVSLYDFLAWETVNDWRLHKQDWRVNKAMQDPRDVTFHAYF